MYNKYNTVKSLIFLYKTLAERNLIMKNKVLIVLLTMIMSISVFSACAVAKDDPPKKDPGKEETEKNEPEDLIYDSDSELYLITDGTIDGGLVTEILAEIMSHRSEAVQLAAVDSEAHDHEIVIGNTDRPISKSARDRMNRIEKNTDDERILLIYSDGSSLAVVWEEDDDGVAEDMAISYFRDNCVKSELTAPRGTIHSEKIDLLEYYTERDDEYKASLWEQLEENHGKEIADAMRRYYTIFDPRVITWFAGLYDPDICICRGLYGEEECAGTRYCGGGGFYYSNSARDNVGYLPDAESTRQTLTFLSNAGLAYNRDGLYTEVITDEMIEQIGDFIYSLEEPNGYFYHPQWGIEFTDTKLSRRARDLDWCCMILKAFGRTPKYTTASGMKGEDVLGTAFCLSGRLGQSCVSAVSKVILTATDSYAPHLQDADAFALYLAGKDIRNSSYSVGNELTSQTAQIQERDRQIGTPDDPTPLMDCLVEWLNENQNPETGTWDYKKPTDAGYSAYYGVNGLMKISGIYSSHKALMPNAEAAVRSAISDAMSEADATDIVNVYNPWVAIRTVLGNLRDYGGRDGENMADRLLSEIMEYAPDAIDRTRQKVIMFSKEDGSYGYTWKYSPTTSQGCPVSVPSTVEGDVNGGSIALNGVLSEMLSALGIDKIPQFGERERYLFRKEIAELSPVIKIDGTASLEPIDFDYEEIGTCSEFISVSEDSSAGTALIISDPTGRSDGKVTEIISGKGKGFSTSVNCQNTVSTAGTYVFEGDLYIDSYSTNYPVQISLGTCYMFTLRENADGELELWESSSTTTSISMDRYLGVTVKENSWFRVKAEVYSGDSETVRIKFYCDTDLTDGVDMRLMTVTDNYFDNMGKKLDGEGEPSKSFPSTRIYVLSDAEARIYIDNLACYRANLGYTEVIDPNNQPYFNIDAPSKDRLTYDFSDGRLPEDFDIKISEEDIKVNNNKLSLIGSEFSSMVNIPTTVREKGARCDHTSFKISFTAADTDTPLIQLTAKDGENSIFGFNIIVLEDADGKYLTLQGKGSGNGPVIENVKLRPGEEAVISLDYYRTEGVVIVYANGSFAGASISLYESAKRFTMDSLMIKTVLGTSFDITLDDIVVEKNISRFTDAVSPDKDEKIYDFGTGAEDITLLGAGTSVASGELRMNVTTSLKHSVTVPINERSNISNSAVVAFDINFNKTASSGSTHIIKLTDKSKSKVIASFELWANGTAIDLYEVGKTGRATNPIYSFSSSDTANLRFEIFTDESTVYIYDGDSIKAKSSIFAGKEHIESGIAYLIIESGDARTNASFDNLRAETLYSVYKDIELVGTNNPERDLQAGIDFESSSTGSLPTVITTRLNGTNNITVENMQNGVTGEYSNVLVLDKSAEGNDMLTFGGTSPDGSYTCTVFEADLKLDLTTPHTVIRMYFGDVSRKSNAYYVNINNGNTIYLQDISNASGAIVRGNETNTHIKAGEWFNLRIEYYKGTKDTVRIRMLINGECIAVSDNFAESHVSSSPISSFSYIHFFFMNAGKGTVYMDNVSLTYTSDTCNDPVTVNN